MNPELSVIGQAALGTGFTFLMTVLGAGIVFLFREKVMNKIQSICMGFAGGVMMAALVWSLLIPAMEAANEQDQVAWMVATLGFFAGGLLIYSLDIFLSKVQFRTKSASSFVGKETLLFVLAVTLHNIPEGMAVGIAFAMAGVEGGSEVLASAVALAVGIGIQNLPEGAAIALPLKKEGVSGMKAFLIGGLSGIVEPIFGILTVLAAGRLTSFMPLLLSLAAGAMFYVVVDELVPEAAKSSKKGGTWGLFLGFVLMMILDVALS